MSRSRLQRSQSASVGLLSSRSISAAREYHPQYVVARIVRPLGAWINTGLLSTQRGMSKTAQCVFLGAAKTQPRKVTRLRSSPVGRGTVSHLDKGAIEGPVCRVYSFG